MVQWGERPVVLGIITGFVLCTCEILCCCWDELGFAHRKESNKRPKEIHYWCLAEVGSVLAGAGE